MEIASPVWNSETNTYTFKFCNTTFAAVSEKPVYIKSGNIGIITLPDISYEDIINTFIDTTHKWFQTPLKADSVKKRLRHILDLKEIESTDMHEDWYIITFKPTAMIVSSKEFVLKWKIEDMNISSPTISADFLAPTPRARSPEPDASNNEKELRTINIQNSLDTLVPIGELPLSDLPPLSFYPEEDNSDATKSEKKRHIREARLRVALAKLKAKRMEERYYMKYGERADDSESSYLTSDSDSDEYFQQLH